MKHKKKSGGKWMWIAMALVGMTALFLVIRRKAA